MVIFNILNTRKGCNTLYHILLLPSNPTFSAVVAALRQGCSSSLSPIPSYPTFSAVVAAVRQGCSPSYSPIQTLPTNIFSLKFKVNTGSNIFSEIWRILFCKNLAAFSFLCLFQFVKFSSFLRNYY